MNIIRTGRVFLSSYKIEVLINCFRLKCRCSRKGNFPKSRLHLSLNPNANSLVPKLDVNIVSRMFQKQHIYASLTQLHNIKYSGKAASRFAFFKNNVCAKRKKRMLIGHNYFLKTGDLYETIKGITWIKTNSLMLCPFNKIKTIRKRLATDFVLYICNGLNQIFSSKKTTLL